MSQDPRPSGRQSVLVGSYRDDTWIAYPARDQGSPVWAVEMNNRRIVTGIPVDDSELLAGRPSLTPRTAAKINEWLKENHDAWNAAAPDKNG